MTIYVNVTGTTDQNCSCIVKFTPSSAKDKKRWIAHYIIETNKKISKCSMIWRKTGDRDWSNCNENAILGAHIRKKNRSLNNNQYIVPACKTCNNKRNPEKWSFKLKQGVIAIRALGSNCKGTRTVSFSATSAKSTTRNSNKKRTCKRFGCSTCPRGRNQYCSVHKTKKTNKKKECRKRGCKACPRGRNQYCSVHKTKKTNKKKECRKRGCNVVPRGSSNYCSKHSP